MNTAATARRARQVDLAAARTLASAGFHGLARALFARHGIDYQSPVAAAIAEVTSSDGIVLS